MHGRALARGDQLTAEDPPRLTVSRLRIGGRFVGRAPIELRATGSAMLHVAGKPYRGSLRIESASGGGARLLNHVSVEEYLLGVVASEMPERFGLEALKAQAVAARSFALASMSSQGWLYADTRSQMYGGVRAETPLSARAVRETNGQVLTGVTGPLLAWYHSTCGGRTTPAQLVFPNASLSVMHRPVDCVDCYGSPMYSWQRRISSERMCRAMDLPAGPLDMVGVELDDLPGRPERLFVRSGPRATSKAMLSLRRKLSAGLPLSEQLPSTRLARAPRVEGGEIIFDGHGWGHGVGMCQYGAAGFAARGASYRSILRRYYPGANLVRMP